MKNQFKKIDDQTTIIFITYKDNILECYIDSEDLDKVNFIKGTWHITRNRKSNLREITSKENSSNVIITKSKTGVRNVTIENGRYRVRINGKSFGSYSTLEEAEKIAKIEREKIFPLNSDISDKIILI